ncbi:MAG: hypothetical protein WBP12_05030 [Candidatus Saccharimonas sp.]
MPRSHEGAPRQNSTEAPDPNNVAEVSPSPEAATEQQDDRENRKVDVELLGRSFGIRRKIDHGVTQAISGTHDRVAKFKNALSTPKNIYLQARMHSAEDKYKRVQDKADNARFKLTKNFYTNKANKKREKMEGRKAKLDAHTGKMQGRLDHAKARRDHHEGIHNNKLKMYVDRKALAKSRKERRNIRRELRDNGKSRVEAARIIGSMSQEQRRRIGEVSLRLELANRQSNTVNQEKSRAQYQQNSSRERIVSNQSSIQEKLTSRDAAANNAARYDLSRNQIKSRIQSLEQKLATGFDQDDADPVDPNNPDAPRDPGTVISPEARVRLQTELDQARAEAGQLDEQFTESMKFIARTNREIEGLQQSISSSEVKASTAENRIAELDQEIAKQNEKVQKLQQERMQVLSQETGVNLGGNAVEQDQTPTAPQPQPTPQAQASQVSSPGQGGNVVDFQAARARRDAARQTPPSERDNEAA